MAEKTTVSRKSEKKKRWVPIMAPKDFKGLELGETYVEEPSSCIGRFVVQNLMFLSSNPKNQSFNVTFRINEFKDNALHTELISYALQVAQLKRLVRKQKEKIEDSFLCVTKDNINVRIKPSITAKTELTNSKKTLVRMATRDYVSNLVKTLSYNQIMMDIINNDLQKNVKNAIKKVMPIANCTIRTAIRE